jgi:dolichol-phosphate mannosyltransferase
MADVSVVIPVFNNADSLALLNQKLIDTISHRLREIIYVNDGSKDRSHDILKTLSGKNKCIRIIDQDNQGQQKAILNGLRVAKGALIVVMDADLQDDPNCISTMLSNYKVSNSTYFVKRMGRYQSLGKMLTSVTLKSLIWLNSSLHFKAGSYYLLDSRTLKKVLILADVCKHIYMTVIVAHASESIRYVDAHRVKSEKSSYNFIKRFKAGLVAVFCSFECLLYLRKQ